MDAAKKYKGNYCMGFTDKHGKKIQCKISYIPVKLCAFPQKDLVLVAVYGFGKNPMLLVTNLEIQEIPLWIILENMLCHVINFLLTILKMGLDNT